MPVDVKVRIEIGARLLASLQRAPKIVMSEMERAMQASVLYTTGRVKRYMTQIGLVDTGRLRNSIAGQFERVAGGVRGTIGTNVKYARIHEYGGVIRPKRAGGLAIPLTPQARRLAIAMSATGINSLRGFSDIIPVRFGNQLFLISKTRTNVRFVVKQQVRIREKAYLRTGLKQSVPRIAALFRAAANRAMRAIFRGEGAR